MFDGDGRWPKIYTFTSERAAHTHTQPLAHTTILQGLYLETFSVPFLYSPWLAMMIERRSLFAGGHPYTKTAPAAVTRAGHHRRRLAHTRTCTRLHCHFSHRFLNRAFSEQTGTNYCTWLRRIIRSSDAARGSIYPKYRLMTLLTGDQHIPFPAGGISSSQPCRFLILPSTFY